MTTIGDIARVFTGAPKHGRTLLGRGQKRIRVLGVQDVQQRRLGLGHETTTDDPRAIERYRVRPGDVIVTARGAPRAATVRNGASLYIDSNLVGVRCKRYPAPILAAYLNSNRGESALRRLSTSTTGLFAISASKLASVEVPDLPVNATEPLLRLLLQRDNWMDYAERTIAERQRIIDQLLTQTLEEYQ